MDRIYVCSRCLEKYPAKNGANDGQNRHVCNKCVAKGWQEIKSKMEREVK